jgi:hypothetical protein
VFDPEIVKEGGIISNAFEDETLTRVGNPGLDKVTVQAPPEPACTVVGLQERDESVGGGIRDTVVLWEDEPREAVITADPEDRMEPADAVKFAEIEPAGIMIEAGAVSVPLLVESVTLLPWLGALLESVTVQLVLVLDDKLEGLH